MSNRRLLVAVAALAVVLLSMGGLAGCQAGEKYPSRAITIAAYSAAGSPSDLRARVTSKLLEQQLKVPVPVENRTAGSGAAAFTWAKGEPADGYSVVACTQDVAYMVAKADAPFSLDDFDGVLTHDRQPGTATVRADSPWKTIEDLIAYAKANPGKVRFGGTGAGLTYHVKTWKFGKLTGIELPFIPFAGGAEVVPALLGGHIDAAMISPTVPMPHVKEGRLRVLAVASDKRVDYLPDVPTFKERGIDLEFYRWGSFFVKKGTPADRLKILHDAVNKTRESPEWKDFLVTSTEQDVYLSGPDTMKLFADLVAEAKQFNQETGGGATK